MVGEVRLSKTCQFFSSFQNFLNFACFIVEDLSLEAKPIFSYRTGFFEFHIVYRVRLDLSNALDFKNVTFIVLELGI